MAVSSTSFGSVRTLDDDLRMHRQAVANRRAAIGMIASLFVAHAVKATAEELALLAARARLEAAGNK